MRHGEEDEMKELKQYALDQPEKEQAYLKVHIFYGLTNLNDGFDGETIVYFSESDFEIVLQRAEKNQLGIFGIEPWYDGDLYGVEIYEEYFTLASDPKWYQKAFSKFKESGKPLLYAASYEIPKKLLSN